MANGTMEVLVLVTAEATEFRVLEPVYGRHGHRCGGRAGHAQEGEI